MVNNTDINIYKTENRLLAVVGPTATGKSNLSVILAQRLNGEVVSADSVQVYKNFDIGSGKITQEEMNGVTHHLLSTYDSSTDYNIALFQRDAAKAIKDVQSRNKLPILCGGSGLYVNSLIYKAYQLDEKECDNELREKYLALEEQKGKGYLYNLLKEKYPNRASNLHPNDTKRIIRALEIGKDTDTDDINTKETNAWESNYELKIIGLTMERSLLYNRIEARVDKMIESGLIDEIRSLLDSGVKESSNAMQALGYKEFIPYINGECTLEEAVNTVKTNTRHFAKRQLTWFRRDPNITWYEVAKPEDLIDVANDIEKNYIL